MTWCVNSVAHLWGQRQYDSKIGPVESRFVEFGSLGEGYHNYHHVFPYDYSASELGWDRNNNVSTLFIDLMARCGLAYNCKKADPITVEKRIKRTGDLALANAWYKEHKHRRWFRTLYPLITELFLAPTFVYLTRIGIQQLLSQ